MKKQIMYMFKKRIVFKVKGQDNIQIGYLVKDLQYTNNYKVVTVDKKSSYCVSLLSMIERV